MTYQVIQWATGTVGVHAVPAIHQHPDLELAGLWVHSDDKAGRDAGEICGIEPIGVAATQDAAALLDLDADCVSYMAHSDVRPAAVIDDLCEMLAGGKNVVNTSFVALLNPRQAGFLDQLQAACEEGGTSFYTSGIDPGYGNVGLAVHTLSDLESGKGNPTLEVLSRVCGVLGLEIRLAPRSAAAGLVAGVDGKMEGKKEKGEGTP